MKNRFKIFPRFLFLAVFFSLSVTSFLIFSPDKALSAEVSLAWDSNTESNVAGYKLYYGFESSNYTHTIDVGNETSYSISDLESNVVHYFAATAYDSSGNESDFSEEISYLVPKEPAPTENEPPVADAGLDQTLHEGVTVTLDGTNSTDPDGEVVSYSWEQTDGPTVTLLDTADGRVTFTAPDVGPDGASLSFRLTVSDSTGLQSEDDCIVNISWVNIPPTANASFDQTVDEGVIVTLNGSQSSDPDDGIASFLWEQTGGPTVTLSDPSAAQPDFVAPDVSSQDVALTFQLTVEDFGGLRSTDMCVVNVTFINMPPVADAGPNQEVLEEVTVTLDGTNSTDPDGDAVSYLWEQTDGPTVALLDTADGRVTFTAPDVGPDGASLSFRLTVSDSTGLQSEDDCIVNISWVNIPPTANASFDQTVDEGVIVTLNGSLSSDPDDGIVSFLWEQTGGPTVSLSDPSAAQPDFVAPDISSQDVALTFQLTVEDFGGLRSTDMCVVNVTFINMAPVADAGPDQNANAGEAVILDGSNSSDPDDGIASFRWKQLSGTPVVFSDPTALETSFTVPDEITGDDSLVFQLTVVDVGGLTSQDTCIVAMIANVVNFYANPVQSYGGGQDRSAEVTIEDGGSTLRIVGNGWKKIEFPYTITDDTILEFDFQSTAKGEIHGIGFDTDDSISNPILVFQLYGTQKWGILDFDNYGGETPQHYVIPVGQYYTGDVLYLTFANDHDIRRPTAESVFRNVKVYEQTVAPAAPVAVDDSYSVYEGGTLNVAALGVLSNDSDANSDPLEANLVSDVDNGVLSLNLDGSFTYTPDAGFTGTDMFTYMATDGTAESNETTVTIAVVSGGVVNFNVNPVQSYGGGQDVSAAVTIEDGGSTLRIVGNGWKKIEFPYTITDDTILEFDFQSTAKGEIHGIGFDTDDSISNPILVFQLYGTQKWGILDFDNYGGEIPQHYVIPVGQYYTGDVLYLTFANDHDIKNPTAESVFKNVKVYNLD